MNILIVEDNPIQLQSIASIVKRTISGCQIYTADCYEEAVAQLETTVFQIFLLDIDLQQGEERDGVSLAEVIRKDPRYRIVPILFLTGVTSRMSAAVNQAHCYSYLLKPYEESDLVHALTSLPCWLRLSFLLLCWKYVIHRGFIFICRFPTSCMLRYSDIP